MDPLVVHGFLVGERLDVGKLKEVNEEGDHERTRSVALPPSTLTLHGRYDPGMWWVGHAKARCGPNRALRVQPVVLRHGCHVVMAGA